MTGTSTRLNSVRSGIPLPLVGRSGGKRWNGEHSLSAIVWWNRLGSPLEIGCWISPPVSVNLPSLFKLGVPEVLEQAFTQAGFTDIKSERLTYMIDFPSVDGYIQMLQDVAAPIVALLANEPAERQAEVWQGIADAVGEYATADGSVPMPNEAICVVGAKSE